MKMTSSSRRKAQCFISLIVYRICIQKEAILWQLQYTVCERPHLQKSCNASQKSHKISHNSRWPCPEQPGRRGHHERRALLIIPRSGLAQGPMSTRGLFGPTQAFSKWLCTNWVGKGGAMGIPTQSRDQQEPDRGTLHVNILNLSTAG